MVRTKKILSVILAIMMLMQTFVITNFAADIEGFTDFPTNSWSTEAMTAAVENGLLVGTSETTIEPQKNLTRAEFAAIVTRAFGATKTADISKFKDVDENDWFYGSVAKVVQMGVMNGTSDTTFAPNAFMRREEVILAMARILFVDGTDISVLDQFSDRSKIDTWSIAAIAGMVAEDYVHGYEDGTIRPQNYITREELAQLFHNIFKTYISEDGEYDSVAKKGSVIVRSEYVTLKDVTIDGDLIMADGVGEGDFRISDVHVTGKIIARGGEGMNYFVNVTSDGKVIVNDPNGVVNFYNYRNEDTPFKNDNVIENTPATFLEREPAKPSSGSSGVSVKYTLSFYESADATDPMAEPIGAVKQKGSYVVKEEDVPTDAAMEKTGFKFIGWTDGVETKNRDYFVGAKIKDVDGDWKPIYKAEYTITFVTDAGETGLDKLEDETIAAGEIPEITVDASKEFLGWTKTEGSTNVDYTNDQITADVVENVFDSTEVTLYPVIKDKDSYSVIFKPANAGETDKEIKKYDPDYVLTDADVPADPTKADHTFKGWSKDPAATEGEERDYFIGKKISEVEGTWYPVFEENPDVYTITFVTDAGNIVIEKTEGETIDAVEIPVVSVEATQKFNGWTTTAGSISVNFTNDDLTADVVENVFDSTEVTLYPVIVDKDAVDYYVEHYFEQLDGTYVLDSTETLSAKPGEVVTATALTTLPEGYEGENVDHADRVAEGTVPELPDELTLKLYYDIKVLKVNYYDLAVDEEYPVLVYDVKYGGTIDNYCYEDTAFDEADNEAIKAEIENYIEFLTVLGYGKSYDDKYLYNEFEPKDTDGDGVADEYDYAYPIDYYDFDHDHEINFKWYVEDDEEDYVVFDEEHVFYEDLDLFSKVKKLNVVISFPEELVGDEVLTLNVPYEESTRFLDSVRDALYLNDNIATYPETTGMEEKMYDKLSTVGGKFFDGDGVFNDEQEINNTDVMVYFYQMMGGKDGYKKWLWEEVEEAVRDALGRGTIYDKEFLDLRQGRNQEQALKVYFVDNYYGVDFTVEPYAEAQRKYFDSEEFIRMSTEEEYFYATLNNEFIMERVYDKIDGLKSVDAVIDEYIGDKIPAGLFNRLPMEMIEDIYEPRVERFLADLEEARNAAKLPGYVKEDYPLDSGIIFDINLVEELLIPMMEYAEDMHEAAVEKAVSSDNKAAELVEKYYVDNPYTTGKAGNYGVVNYAFNPDFYVTKTRVDENGEGRYKINSFYDIYTEMVMPETVETIDALLWYMDPEGGAVDFARIRNLAEENEDLILALHNHPHNLMKQYAENGLPEDMAQYWDDLLSDPDIKGAVEKLDNKVSFDMMFFVEDKINNATLEMYFMKALDRVGVPAETFLGKYTNSKAYKELTHDDFVKLLDQLEECWETVDGIENYNGTTDYVFDNVLEKVGRSGNEAEAAFKGFEMTLTRFFADTWDQPAPEDID